MILFLEQVDNKDLHLDLLRKKLSAMEVERQGKCALEREVDDHVMMSKKFKVKVEKLSEQLSGLKQENNDLKAQLLDMNGYKVGIIKLHINSLSIWFLFIDFFNFYLKKN